MDISRRQALGMGAASSLALASGCTTNSAADFTLPTEPFVIDNTYTTPVMPPDSPHWDFVRNMFDVTPDLIQLENANWGMMSVDVLYEYQRLTEMVNRDSSYYQRREYNRDLQPILQETADLLGVSVDEIVFTRGATEALQNLIGGYNNLAPGDAVLYCDLDYDSMITAMRWLEQRRGVEVIKIDMPEPATRESVLATYEAAFRDHPNIKLALTTHASHRTGLVMPIAEISRMARASGADIIVDAAHSFGQFEFTLPDLEADFIGINLHKWIGAPIGVGVMYVKKDRIGDIDTYMGEPDRDPPSIHARVHTGTSNFAAYLTLPKAYTIHRVIGPGNKGPRLRYLRDLWAEPLRDHPNVEILTPADPTMYAGITSFRLRGKTSAEDNVALARRLLDEFGIFTVHRTGLAHGACVRVAPSYFNTPCDVIALRDAIMTIAT